MLLAALVGVAVLLAGPPFALKSGKRCAPLAVPAPRLTAVAVPERLVAALLEDRGLYSATAASPYPTDEYVWLGGMTKFLVERGEELLQLLTPDRLDRTGVAGETGILQGGNIVHGFHHRYPDDSSRLVMPLTVSISLSIVICGLTRANV